MMSLLLEEGDFQAPNLVSFSWVSFCCSYLQFRPHVVYRLTPIFLQFAISEITTNKLALAETLYVPFPFILVSCVHNTTHAQKVLCASFVIQKTKSVFTSHSKADMTKERVVKNYLQD